MQWVTFSKNKYKYLVRPPDCTWSHPRNERLDYPWDDSTRPIAELQRSADGRGHTS